VCVCVCVCVCVYIYIYRLLEIEAHENMLRNSFKCERGAATSV
jgi:hypothetical protein